MNDLSSASLQTLVNDLRDAIARGEYDTIEQFAKDFAAAVPKQTLTAEVTADGKPVRTTQIGEEKVNFDGAVKQIVTELEALKTRAVSNPAEAQKLIDTYSRVDEQLTALFKQTEMMQELAERGFDPEEFYKTNEEANKDSEAKAKRFKENAADKRKQRTTIFGEDFRDTDPLLTRKSLITRRDDEMAASSYVESMIQLVSQMNQLSKANDALENEIAAHPEREATLRGNIDANKAQIATLTTNLKGQRDKLSDLNLPNFTAQMDSVRDIDDRTKVTYDEALSRLETIAENDYGTKTVYDPTTGEPTFTRDVRDESRLNEIYLKMSEALLATNRKGKAVIDSASPRGQAISKLKNRAATPAEIEAGRKEIDDFINEMDKEISTNEKAQTREETLIAARKASVVQYKDKYDRMKELNEKFDRVQQQAKDDQGHPLFLHAPDADHPEAYPTTEDTGTPIMTTELQPKTATQTEYLADFDEASKKAQIEADGKAAMAGYTWSERRALMKEAGIGSAFSRFFRAMRKLNTSDTRLLTAATREKTAELEAQKAQHIEAKRSADAAEYDDLVERVGIAGKDGATRDGAMTKGYQALNRTAVTHSGMQEGAYQVVDNGKEESGYVDAMQASSYEEISLIAAQALLPDSQARKFEEVRKAYTHKEVARRNLEKPGRDIKTENPKNPVIKDQGEER